MCTFIHCIHSYIHTFIAHSLKTINYLMCFSRNQWHKLLVEASENYKDTEKRKKERAHSHRQMKSPGVGRLFVTVIEGMDLKPNESNGNSNHSTFSQ